VISADGKSRTVTVSLTGGDGKNVHSTAMYDKE
jgi:VCBS repeat-containing protein